MATGSDWWERRLSRAPAAPATPNTWNLPRHATPTPAASAPPPAQIPQYQAPVATDDGQIHVADAITRWRGGLGTHKETDRCPNCGGTNYFSRTIGHTGERLGVMNKNGTVCAPAPQCADCSFNGLFAIFGGD